MHFSKIPFITLCVITIVASRVIRRDFDTVDDDLALIQDDIDNLGAAVAAFDGTGPLAIAVGQAAGTLEFHLDQATGHTVGSAPFNDLESDELTSTAAALAPQHVVGLSALVARVCILFSSPPIHSIGRDLFGVYIFSRSLILLLAGLARMYLPSYSLLLLPMMNSGMLLKQRYLMQRTPLHLLVLHQLFRRRMLRQLRHFRRAGYHIDDITKRGINIQKASKCHWGDFRCGIKRFLVWKCRGLLVAV